MSTHRLQKFSDICGFHSSFSSPNSDKMAAGRMAGAHSVHAEQKNTFRNVVKNMKK
jgi:hypothetical protein